MSEKIPSIREDTGEQLEERIQEELIVNELPEEYEALVEGVRFIQLSSSYAEQFEHIVRKSELQEILSNNFLDQTVLDLGCGNTSTASTLSESFGANRYIGVDLAYKISGADESDEEPSFGLGKKLPTGLKTELPVTEKQNNNENSDREVSLKVVRVIPADQDKSMEEVFVESDMLNFISRLESNSVGVVIISGIEQEALSDINTKYIEILQKEVARILKTEGIFVVYDSEVNPSGEPFKLILKEEYLAIYEVANN